MTKPKSRTRTLPLGSTHHAKAHTAGKVIGAMTLFLMFTFSCLTATQLYLTPDNPGWWAVAWVFGGIAVMAGGHLFELLPSSAAANGLMVAVFLLGFLVVPFGVHFLLTWNMAVGLIAVPFAIAFAVAVKHYWRMVAAHRA